MSGIDVSETKEVWLVISNTDLTEGRGNRLIKHVCDEEATARRLGAGKYVMGTDCPVSAVDAFWCNGWWYAPCHIEQPSKEDSAKQDQINRRREAIRKAKLAGLSDEDLNAMGVSTL